MLTTEEQQCTRGYTSEELRRLEDLATSGYFTELGRRFRNKNVIDIEVHKSLKKGHPAPQVQKPKEFVLVSDVEKLRLVRCRREKWLALREHKKPNFLHSLRSTESPLQHIRKAEIKGLSYWYRKGQQDYVENWFLKYTPIRRYYEAFDDAVIDNAAEKLALTMTSSERFALTPITAG